MHAHREAETHAAFADTIANLRESWNGRTAALVGKWPEGVPQAVLDLISRGVKRKVAASIAVHPPKYYALVSFLMEWMRCPAAFEAMSIYVVFQFKQDLKLFRETLDCVAPGTPELWVPIIASEPKKGWMKAVGLGNQFIAAFKKYWDRSGPGLFMFFSRSASRFLAGHIKANQFRDGKVRTLGRLGAMDGAPVPLDGSEAFVTYGRGLLKVFNAAKNFGFISPVFKGAADVEGPPLPRSVDEGIWFFGNHSLPYRAIPGVELTFEIWENASGKAQARSVSIAAEPSAVVPVEQKQEIQHHPMPEKGGHWDKGGGKGKGSQLHPNEPRVIYPSVYVSDVPVEWNEAAIRKLHRQLGLNPDTIMGLKFLPFTEVSLGLSGSKGEKQATPVTGSVILRYLNEEAANAAVERLKGHPIQTSSGVTKHLGAKHATPPKWVVQRKQQEDEQKKITGGTADSSKGKKLKTEEGQSQKVSGSVHRVSMAGYGVIKSPEWGEVLWRQYELPTNLRCLQFTDRAKFVSQVEHREDYRRLKEMVGKQVEAELYKLPDGQVRASHVRAVAQHALPEAKPGDDDPIPMAERPGNEEDGPPSFPPMPGMPFPGGPPPPGFPPGAPPFMDPAFAHMMGMPPGMPPPWAMGRDKKKKEKKDKKDKKEKKEKKSFG
eukprot:s2845_g3.t2